MKHKLITLSLILLWATGLRVQAQNETGPWLGTYTFFAEEGKNLRCT